MWKVLFYELLFTLADFYVIVLFHRYDNRWKHNRQYLLVVYQLLPLSANEVAYSPEAVTIGLRVEYCGQ